MKTTRPALAHRLRPAVVLAVLAALLLIPRAFAADAAWNVDAAGSWSDATNWSPATAPGATNTTNNADVATFGINVTAARTISVDANRNIGGITFNHTSSVSGNAYTVGSVRLSDGGVIQQINSTGANTNSVGSTVYIQGDGGSATFRNTTSGGNNRLIINDARGVSTAGNTTTLYLDGISTAANTVSSTISDGTGGGNLAIIKNGTGTWRLTGNNTYSGGTTVNAGILQFGHNNAFGTGAITLGSATNSAALTLTTDGTFTVTNKIVAAGNFQLTGRVGSTLTFSGDMDLGGATRTITSGTVGVSLSGDISNGGLTKMGATTLTLQGNNTYTGNTTVNAGTLTLDTTSVLTFSIGGNGINNAVLGTGAVLFNGAFHFDLGGADSTYGNSWNIVDVDSLSETFGGTFAVDGFTGNSGVWTFNDSGLTWTFAESTGVLNVVPEPGTIALLGLGLGAVLYGLRRGKSRRAVLPPCHRLKK